MEAQVTFSLPPETLDWLRALAGDTGRGERDRRLAGAACGSRAGHGPAPVGPEAGTDNRHG